MILSIFYLATSGSSWTKNNNWMTGDPCLNTWYGVVCTNQEVTALSSAANSVYEFSSNNLVGTIPSQLGLLTKLTDALVLTLNSIGGSSVPSELGQLTGLNGISIRSNSFTGSIPR